ncbi:MAG: hypothetical protein AB7T06_29060 [Kofleriaceae bacterium]
MKTILALTAIGILATPALAGKHRPALSKAKPAASAPKKSGLAAAPAPAAEERDIVLVEDKAQPKLDLGEDFGLKSARASAKPDCDEETFDLKRVSNKEAVALVKSKTDELEYCWVKLPAKKRVETSGILHIAIEASGSVAGAWIDGSVPAAVEKCMTDRAAKWVFPAADAGSEIEHGISFSLLESKGK